MPDIMSVVVSKEAFDSSDPEEIVGSNISFLNALFSHYMTVAEVSQAGMRSYYVDYYLAQIGNGGFSQFVYNSRWREQTITYVREGLREIGSTRHAILFERGADILDSMGPEKRLEFFESDYFGDNEERDFLNTFDDAFWKLSEEEDLLRLNATWLRALPDLIVVPEAQIDHEIKLRAGAITDLDQRIETALAKEPRSTKLIRALCKSAGHDFSYLTAADAMMYQGKSVMAFHFITDGGHHYMIESSGMAMMFSGGANVRVAEIEAMDGK